VGVAQVDRQAAHHRLAPLDQLEGARQGERTGAQGEQRLLVAARVREYVVPDGALVPLKRHHLRDHPARGDHQAAHTGVEQEHLAGQLAEVGGVPVALADHRGEGIGGGEGAVQVLLDLEGGLAGEAGDALPVVLHPPAFEEPGQAAAQDQAGEEGGKGRGTHGAGPQCPPELVGGFLWELWTQGGLTGAGGWTARTG